MKEYKNRTIKIFDTEWKIKFLDKVYTDENKWVFGLSVGAERTLYVSLKDVKSLYKFLIVNFFIVYLHFHSPYYTRFYPK